MKTRFRRLFAAFLLVNMLQSIFLPPALHALTSGPTTPETTSFEPVDTTDMVNLTTGDFTYNVPLIEVPSPEGGYPVSLSYHAGIKPLEDASWVGLGWTLNPGAINRTVNGYPDDQKGVSRNVVDSWQGGTTKTFSVGVGIGIKQMGGGVGVELSLSNDTYRGFSGDVALTASVGFKLSENIGIGVSASAGTNGFTAGANIGFSTSAGIKLAGGVSTNFSQISGGISASQSVNTYQSKSGTFTNSASLWSTGVNFSSRGLKPSMSVGGFQARTNNANYGKISTYSMGLSVPIPIGPITLSLGYNYVRYWMLERDQVNVYGSLYARDAAQSISGSLPGGGPTDKSFDSYAMLDTSLSMAVHNNPEWLLGGSLPAYDQFQVMGQGVSGTMKPLITENISLFREKVPDNTNNPSLATNYAVTTTHSASKIRFRFDNDFASYMTKTPGTLSFANNSSLPYTATLSSHSTTIPSEGFAGSRNIEWYKNSEIKPDASNVRVAKNQGFINSEDMPDNERGKVGAASYPALNDQIGGFMITNESGTTYHYALPVYAYNDHSNNFLADPVNGNSSNTQNSYAPYAYTWLLTAITGPDYVDDGDGIADDGDYGYWVKFRYGKWVDDYNWRTPETGYMYDLKSKIETYSCGTKQLYYLDAIVTRTHTALFVKDIRKDGKSVSYPEYDSGFAPYSIDDVNYETSGLTYYYWSKSTLKLDEIYLVKNEVLANYGLDVDQIRLLSSSISQSVPTTNQSGNSPAHYGGKVIDKNDLLLGSGVQVAPNAVKSIGFTTDYSLCGSTVNSFDNTAYYTSDPANSVRTLSGKLSLKRLVFRGRNSTVSLPPLEFTYDNTDALAPYTITGSTEANRRINIANTSFANGDLLYMETNATTYEYAMIYDKDASNNYKLMKVGGTTTILSGTPNVKKTYNPPFSKYKYDYWGYYKPDFMTNSHASNLAAERQPSVNSSKNTSVWSLRQIKTSLGSDVSVTYEPKDYSSAEMLDFENLNIKSIVAEPDYGHGNRKVKIMFKEGYDLSMIFKAGQALTGIIGYTISSANCGGQCGSANESINVLTVATDYIIVTLSSSIYNGLVASCQGYPPNLVTVYASYSQSGLVKMPQPFTIGDGIRVKAVNLIGSDGLERVTNYTYQNGKTSYLPVSLNQDPISFCNAPAELEQYNLALRNLMVKSREIPGPGVIYRNVSVEEKAGGVSQGRRDYTFETFDKSMVILDYSVAPVPEQNITLTNGETMTVSYRNVQINNRTSRVGNLLKLQEFNSLGQLVRTVDNTYATSNAQLSDYKNQGTVQEAYNEVRPKEKSSNSSDQHYNFRKSVVTSRKTYPSFMMSSTVREANGNTTTSYNRAFDLFSGEPTVTETIDPYGIMTRSVSVPAYRVSSLYRNGDGSPSDLGMGLKINNIKNKHMLIQNAGSYLFRINSWWNPAITTNPEYNGVTAVLDASITTWNKDWAYRDYNATSDKYPLSATTDNTNRVWRKHKQWLLKKDLNPDGSLAVTLPGWLSKTNGSALIAFDPAVASEATNVANGWQKVSEVTYYDRFSKPLEEVDINGNYAAAKMGYGTGNGAGNRNTLVIATATPSKYVEFAFSGAEDYYSPEANVNYFGGEVLAPGSSSVSSAKAHTGDRSIKLNSTNVYGFGYRANVGTGPDQIARKKYEAMVWVDSVTAQAGRKYLYCNVYNSSDQSISWTAATINDANAVRVGGWFRLRLPIDLTNLTTATRIEVGTWTDGQTTDVYLDDLRFKPADAVMTSYVYDTQTDQVRFILDNDHLYTEYRYDKAGRLIAVLKETPENPTGKRAISQHIYHYMRDKQ